MDVGAARVGIARGGSLAKIAEPLKTVAAEVALAELTVLSKASSAAAIVVGLPRNLDGNETQQTQAVRAWTKTAQAKLNLPFYWQDEALTTQQAESGKRRDGGGEPDAQAAAIILQDFLDTPKEERVRC